MKTLSAFLISMTVALFAFVAQADDLNKIVGKSSKGTYEFLVELASSSEERAKGLMHRTDLPKETGMLFDFGRNQRVHMWMKNTPLPLDMVFIRSDGTIARIEVNTVPFSLDIIPSIDPVRYVLEVNGGMSAKVGMKAGDKLGHPWFDR